MMKSKASGGFRIEDEFSHSSTGDQRRTKRLTSVARQFFDSPESSIPEACTEPSDLEGPYRLLSNDDVRFNDILSGHHDETVVRAQRARGEILVLHDTSEFAFSGEREELWPLRGKIRPVVFSDTSLCEPP